MSAFIQSAHRLVEDNLQTIAIAEAEIALWGDLTPETRAMLAEAIAQTAAVRAILRAMAPGVQS